MEPQKNRNLEDDFPFKLDDFELIFQGVDTIVLNASYDLTMAFWSWEPRRSCLKKGAKQLGGATFAASSEVERCQVIKMWYHYAGRR